MRRQATLTFMILCLVLATAGQLFAEPDPAARLIRAETPKGEDPIGTPSFEGGTGGPDGFGYTYIDSTVPGGPTYNFIDIEATGTPIALSDDASAPVALGFTFSYYGTDYTSVALSSNGYLTLGPDGTDFSNDCPLAPGGLTPPDSIFPYWDDLDPGDDGALAYSETFGSCPVGDATACTILQWEEFDFFPGDGMPGGNAGTFQAVLYDNGSMLYQYQGGPGLDGSSATVGIWEDTLANSLLYTCNGGGISGGLAILFLVGDIGDLSIDKSGAVGEGGPYDYAISVDNLGPDDQTGVTVTDVFPPEIDYVSDSCGGSFAGGTWTWDVGDLSNGAIDTCDLTVELNVPGCVAVTNTASVTGDLGDPGGNNSSTTSNGGGNVVADPGFEAGTPNPSWAEASTNFGTPLCTVGGCGVGGGTGPFNGMWWAWFGGIAAAEEGSVTQDVVIGTGVTNLTFWLEAPVCDVAAGAAHFMEATIDGTQVFLIDASSALCNVVGYSQQTADISAFADGGTHTLEFHSIVTASGITNFFVDDVEINSDATCVPVGPTTQTIDIPTLNEVGLAILVLLLAAGGALLIRRRQSETG